jgi:hypothetical protein
VLFALVANRALAPSSKLAATRWIASDVAIDGLDGIHEDACYRAMDALLEVEAALAREIYDEVADFLNLEVDLLFFDTTSTYFQLDEADAPVARDERGRRPRRAGHGRGAECAGPVPQLRQVQGPPRRPAPGRGRHGGHPH